MKNIVAIDVGNSETTVGVEIIYLGGAIDIQPEKQLLLMNYL
ncbi:MAG: hypothetical protein Ct9H90mP10_00180 [Actinomycetota bacterium]|nr:MAG: hypothetical protein Ct9H90mP10_00180 [Actinomycetota bacterium]